MAGAGGFMVRDARPQDLEAIVGFNLKLAAETERKQLDRAVLLRGVNAALLEPDRLRYWVAEREGTGELVGQAAITREWSAWRNGWIWWVQSVYVAPEARGQGVFRSLHAHIRAQARSAPDVVGLRLYVEHENERAQRTYQSLGMTPGGYHVYEDFWTDRVMPARG